MCKFFSLLLLCAVSVAPAFARQGSVTTNSADAPSTQRAQKRILVFNKTEGFRHASIPTSTDVFKQLDATSDLFEFVVTDDVAHFDREKLNTYDAVVFCLTTGEIKLSEEQKAALLEFVQSGKGGLVGIHSATDTFYKWPEFGEMMGGYFDGHPWNAKDTVTVKIEQVNPITAPWGKSRFEITDEIYQFKEPYDRSKQEVLLSLDTDATDMTKKGIKRTDKDFAVAWTKTYGKGRVFYTSLGHNDAVWKDPRFQAHVQAGLQWVTRAETGKPTETGETPAVK
ncbi:MAG TPA: ThuA domain-containing protein [Tepidisphaeraceae bacterium]|nr:ThuA domain-containing protein [Tepidisphaeraceae bacterium]